MEIADSLLEWFQIHARDLPWRTEVRDAYRTLVSEIMLQQTQVDRVVPRFVNFIRRWPDLESLAEASEEDVLGMWSGLGYYRRARLLHRLARQVVDSGEDHLPASFEALKALPGIGDYTAAAVGSLAFGLEVPVMDGNVQRVVSRVTAFAGDPRTASAQSRLKSWVGRLFPGHDSGAVNEALMELGATVCTPSGPRCDVCPFTRWCRAFRAGSPEEYPPPRKVRAVEDIRWVAACFEGPDGRWLLRRVEDGPILRGLWLPPFVDLQEGSDPVGRAIGLAPEGLKMQRGRIFEPVRHHITHRRIEVVPVLVPVSGGGVSAAVWQWSRPGEVVGGTSTLFEKLYKSFRFNRKKD